MVGIEDPEASIKPRTDSTRLPLTDDERLAHGPFSLRDFFPGSARLEIESGKRHPERRYLGLERSLAYYRIARDRIARSALSNVRVLRCDAREFVAGIPDDFSDAFHAYFLDPWPKKKQRKRRLLTAEFLALLWSRTRPGGTLRIITDHEDYAANIRQSLAEAARAGAPWREEEWDAGGLPAPTHYELKYRAVGRELWKAHLRKA